MGCSACTSRSSAAIASPGRRGALAFIAAQGDRLKAGHGWAWAITSVTGDVLGHVGALWIAQPAGRASIGYWTHNANRRGGFTADAVAAAADWLLTEGGVARLEAFIEPWNVGSIRVAECAGFEKEGLMKSFAPLNGERKDAYLSARIASSRQNHSLMPLTRVPLVTLMRATDDRLVIHIVADWNAALHQAPSACSV
jgi:ribosomal-protein-alanine N-acetyltransferase